MAFLRDATPLSPAHRNLCQKVHWVARVFPETRSKQTSFARNPRTYERKDKMNHAETQSTEGALQPETAAAMPSRRGFLAASALLGAMLLSPLWAVAASPATAPASVATAEKAVGVGLPQRVTLTCAADMAHAISATWRSAGPLQSAQGQIAPLTAGPKFEATIQSVPAEAFTIETDSGETAYQYNLTFTGLTPDAQYCFRVGDGQSWSEWNTVQTALDKPKPFSFLYFGDVQTDIRSQCSRAVRTAFRHAPDARFVICAGDLVNHGHNDSQWGEFSDAFGFIAATVPCLPTPGNHDTKRPEKAPEPEAPYTAAPAYHAHFHVPANGPKNAPILNGEAYYVDCQGVRVISLNSNVFDDDAPTDAAHKQAWDALLAWLEEVLANNPNRWTVVTHHHPIYSTSKGRDNAGLRNLLRPLYDKYKVDLVLQGHDHSYGRTHKLAGDQIVDPAAPGTIYVVSVLGPKMYPFKPKFESLMAATASEKQLFQVIEVDGDTLSYKSRSIDGQLVDAFQLKKDASGASTYHPAEKT